MNLKCLIMGAEIDGYMELPWKPSKTATQLINDWYENRDKHNKPMIAIYLKDDGGGEIRYDMITVNRRLDPRVDYKSILRELDYELYPKLKTRVCKDVLATPGEVWGEYVFLKQDKQKIVNCVLRHIEEAIKNVRSEIHVHH